MTWGLGKLLENFAMWCFSRDESVCAHLTGGRLVLASSLLSVYFFDCFMFAFHTVLCAHGDTWLCSSRELMCSAHIFNCSAAFDGTVVHRINWM